MVTTDNSQLQNAALPREGEVGSLFFELLQVAIGNREGLSESPTPEMWEELYEMAKRQSLVGIAFAGIERLPDEQRPGERLFLEWAGWTNRIVQRNERMNELSRKLCERFQREGFQCCVLKGQGNSAHYGKGLGRYRQSGDIDVWVWKENAQKGREIREIIEYCRGIRPEGHVFYHDLEFPVIPDCEVEVHYRPAWLSAPRLNSKLQRWFKEPAQRRTRQVEGFPVPYPEFDLVFQLVHIYKHLFQEGIGLRQVMDYYCLMKHLPTTLEENVSIREEARKLMDALKLTQFAQALMWVMGEVFEEPRHEPTSEQAKSEWKEKWPWMLVEPDERRGRHLLNEIMLAGNFGKYDPRHGDLSHEGSVHRFCRKTARAARLVRLYPHEALWIPPFMVYHTLWRGCKLWKRE